MRRPVREIVEWFGGTSCRSSARKSRNANESAARQAIPRSESMPHRGGVEAGTLRFDEVVEAVLSQQLIQPTIEG